MGEEVKCEENGGCPLAEPYGRWATPRRDGGMCGLWPIDLCHLTPADFDIIRAMIAGEVSKERRELALKVLTAGTIDTVRIAAAIAGVYQPTESYEYTVSGGACEPREDKRKGE